MPDTFLNLSDSPLLPSRAPYNLVPHDTNALPVVTKAIYVGTGGTLVVRGIDAATDVTYRNVPSGTYVQVRAGYVRLTGTTATDLIGEA